MVFPIHLSVSGQAFEDPYSSFPLAPLRLILFNGLFLPYRDCEAQNTVCLPSVELHLLSHWLARDQAQVAVPACWLPMALPPQEVIGVFLVFSARSSGAVCRSLMLFKIKVIVTFPGEQRMNGRDLGSPQAKLSLPPEHSTCTHRKHRAQ